MLPQREALALALRSKLLVITGGPGVNSILKILVAKGVNILLAAPNVRAAKRMTETRTGGTHHPPAARSRSR